MGPMIYLPVSSPLTAYSLAQKFEPSTGFDGEIHPVRNFSQEFVYRIDQRSHPSPGFLYIAMPDQASIAVAANIFLWKNIL
jgi:hypothetical protein